MGIVVHNWPVWRDFQSDHTNDETNSRHPIPSWCQYYSISKYADIFRKAVLSWRHEHYTIPSFCNLTFFSNLFFFAECYLALIPVTVLLLVPVLYRALHLSTYCLILSAAKCDENFDGMSSWGNLFQAYFLSLDKIPLNRQMVKINRTARRNGGQTSGVMQ